MYAECDAREISRGREIAISFGTFKSDGFILFFSYNGVNVIC